LAATRLRTNGAIRSTGTHVIRKTGSLGGKFGSGILPFLKRLFASWLTAPQFPHNQMSNMPEICDDGPIDDSMLDSYSATSAAVLEPVDDVGATDTEWAGACCEKCNARLLSDVVSVCGRCGWYASMGAYIELDPSWETDSEAEPVAVETTRPNVQHWLALVPRWCWVIAATVSALLIESVVARLVTPADSWIRTAWSLSQLAIGLSAAFGCHVFNFLVLAAEDADFGLLDLLMKPLKLWARAIQNLPLRLWVANTATTGLAAALLSVLIIGGIPYDRLWDWGVKQPPKQDLMGAIMDRVKKLDNGKESDDLEKSIGDFAGKKGDELNEKPKTAIAKPRENTDCVILGYLLDGEGGASTLLLGTASGGQLVYAGNVTPKLPADEMKTLTESLKSIESKRPIIRIDYDATWVQPKYTCRVTFGQRAKSGRLRDIEWSKLLGSIEKR
jgi:hypothetical protein